MSSEGVDYTLPAGPIDLCFDKNEFIKNDFSVDQFLQDHRRKANLEIMRDNLGIYLKVLRSAMIELINRDYADFVNLSSNLIGLDKAISRIQIPLGQLKEEVLQVKLNLDEAIHELSCCLKERNELRVKKTSLQNLVRVLCFLQKLEVLLEVKVENETDNPDPDLVERAASEYNQLQFCVTKCEAELTDNLKRRVVLIKELLTSSLDKMFLKSLQEENADDVVRCLRIYILLDKISDAEYLYRKQIVGPYMHDVISEVSLQSDPRNLKGVYSQILAFLDIHMKTLMQLTTRGIKLPTVKGFNFLVNSFWSEVEQRLETYLPSIYAPGNPDVFYQRYSETLEFLAELERHCGTQFGVTMLRKHPQYESFLQRWNLPVYFQIRFQEIGGMLEGMLALSPTAMISKTLESESEFYCLASSTTWECLIKCWSTGVFLEQLLHRFWKLCLQLIARYHTWVGEILIQDWPVESIPTDVSSISSPTDSFQEVKEDNLSKLDCMVRVYVDIDIFLSKLPQFLEYVFMKIGHAPTQVKDLLSSSLDESKSMLLTQIPTVTDIIVMEVCIGSLMHLRQVSDIPRLFRRTNREMPTKPCPYVKAIMGSPLNFYEVQKCIISNDLLLQWMIIIFSAITKHYLTSVNDVLTSVQKTEESLRRLKKIRDKSVGTSSEGKGAGDDDKIRQQLLLDVQNYCTDVESIGVKRDEIEDLENLLKLVENACNRDASR